MPPSPPNKDKNSSNHPTFGEYWNKKIRKKKLTKIQPPMSCDLIAKDIYGDLSTPKRLIKHIDLFNIRSCYMIDGCKWINSFNCERVLDVGCGDNIFKGLIHNIIGLDQFNEKADIVFDIESISFPDSHFDGIIIHGGIQYGTWDQVLSNFDNVMKWTKPNSPVWFRYRQVQVPEKSSTWGRNNGRHRRSHNYQWTSDNIAYIKSTYNLHEIETWDWNRYGADDKIEDYQIWHKFIKDPK
jgi:hypothetical protein